MDEKKEIEIDNNEEMIDEDLEFLKAQLRHKKMIEARKNEQEEKEEDYEYIKTFKINSIIEIVMGLIALVFGILTKNYIAQCLGVTVICFGYLFGKIAKRGEMKRDQKMNKKDNK